VLPETVLLLHEQLIAQFGGSPGVRELSLLESALSRPRHRQSYANATVFELAACYAFGLVKNHPFVDGNKRIAFTVAVLFLELNRRRFVAPEADAVVQTLALAAGETSERAYAEWLKRHTRRAQAE
jgi:death-on-curing protein